MRLATGQTVMYSGDETLHKGGVAIMFNQQAERSLMEWTLVSKRIMIARFYTSFRRVTVIQVYAPLRETKKRKNYSTKSCKKRWMDGCNKNDFCIIMGDLNAKVGKDNTGFERTIGMQAWTGGAE